MSRLRLVHFGFSKEASWDVMYDGVSRGWDCMLWTLKEYLDHHKGSPRDVVYLRAKVEEDGKERAWSWAFSADGIMPGLSTSLKAGDAFTASVAGEVLEGAVRLHIPGVDFQGKIDSLNGAILRLQTDPCQSGGGEMLSVSMSTFGVPPQRVDAIRGAWRARLASRFGASSGAGKEVAQT